MAQRAGIVNTSYQHYSIRRRVADRWAARREYSLRGKFELRRGRVAHLRQQIMTELPFEQLAHCPCAVGRASTCKLTVVAMADRYGFPIRLALCERLGMFYLVDRLTEDGYEEFYRRGLYRQLIAAFWGRRVEGAELIRRQRIAAISNARIVLQALRGQLRVPRGGALLDIGGSTGDLAHAFASTFELQATVVDPAEDELELARGLGLTVRCGLCERIEFGSTTYDVIVLNQSVEHLVDVHATFAKIQALLKPTGYFIFDIGDFLCESESYGCAEAASRLDHCQVFFDEMMDVFCRNAGFVIDARIAHKPGAILYVCRKGEVGAVVWPEERPGVARTLLMQATRFTEMSRVPLISREERVCRRLLSAVRRS